MVALYDPATFTYAFQVTEMEMMKNPKVWYEVYRLVRSKVAIPNFEKPKLLEGEVCSEVT